jgi:hypothetical protein
MKFDDPHKYHHHHHHQLNNVGIIERVLNNIFISENPNQAHAKAFLTKSYNSKSKEALKIENNFRADR